jgi:cytoskeletal protein RodZ
MENEDFDILPAGTYVKGFLRTYGEYLGLDYQVLLDEYNERFGSGDHKEHIIHVQKNDKTEKAPKRKSQTNYLLVAIIAVVIIAVLDYMGWGNPDNEEPVVAPTTANTTATSTSTTESVLPATVETTPVPVPEPVVLESLTLTATDSAVDFTFTRDEPKGPELIKGQLQPGESIGLNEEQLQSLTEVWLDSRSVNITVNVNGEPRAVPEFDPVNDYLLISLTDITTVQAQ